MDELRYVSDACADMCLRSITPLKTNLDNYQCYFALNYVCIRVIIISASSVTCVYKIFEENVLMVSHFLWLIELFPVSHRHYGILIKRLRGTQMT